MTKIISDYFHQVDISMGLVWQNNPLLLILISLFQLIFCSICAIGFWTSILDSKSYSNGIVIGISSYIETRIKGLKGSFLMLLFTFISYFFVVLFYGISGYIFFKIAKATHDSFVYNQELFIIFK